MPEGLTDRSGSAIPVISVLTIKHARRTGRERSPISGVTGPAWTVAVERIPAVTGSKVSKQTLRIPTMTEWHSATRNCMNTNPCMTLQILLPAEGINGMDVYEYLKH